MSGREETVEHIAGRKRNSAEDIVHKQRRADELAAERKTGEESPPSCRCRRPRCTTGGTYGGMDTDASSGLKVLREQNARLKRLLAEAELKKDALPEVAKGRF